MIDLKLRFRSDYASISWAISAAGFGHFLGAFIGGVLVDLLGHWQDMLVTVSQLLAVAVVVAMPFVNSVVALGCMFFAMGTNIGVTSVSGHRILLKMWKERTPVPMHVLHFGLGLGAAVAPLIVNNFLAKLKFDEPSINASTILPRDQHPYVVVEESRVHLAFVAIGLVVALLCSPFFVYSFHKCYKQLRRGDYANSDGYTDEKSKSVCEIIRSMVNPATYSDSSRGFSVFLCMLVLLFFMNVVGGEHTLGKFIRTYSVDAAHFPRDEASYLDTSYWASFAVGRCVSAVLAYYVCTRRLLIMATLFNTTIGTIFALFTSRSHAALWICTVLAGVSFSPLYPACISFTNTHIELGGVILILIDFAAGFGNMIYMGVTGSLYHIYGPQALLYVVAFCCLLSLIIVIVLGVGTYKLADRFSKTLSEDTGLVRQEPETTSDDQNNK